MPVVGSFGLVVDGFGPAEPGAVPEGVLVVGLDIVPVVPDGVVLESVDDVAPVPDPVVEPVVEPLPIEPDDDGDEVELSPDVDGVVLDDPDDPVVAELPVVLLLDGFDIELSVFGASLLLQAAKPVTDATAAVTASHLIERSMFAPVG